MRSFVSLVSIVALAGCSSHGPAATAPDASQPSTDGSPGATADAPTSPTDGALPALTACGPSITPLGACDEVVPSEVGADPNGINATFPSYALTPAPGVAPRDQLLVYLNGTGAHPSEVASASVNFYNTATALGYHVIALSYRSDKEVTAKLCNGVDACIFPTRESLILGTLEPGAQGLDPLLPSEGITARLFMTLNYLAAADPNGGWGQYLLGHDASAVPDTQIAWSSIAVAGHSQGGGHAAAIAKLFHVARVVQLASTCDVSGTARNINDVVAATWTDGSGSGWATDPHTFYGLVDQTTFDGSGNPTGGDLQCFTTILVWANLGMAADREDTMAATCGMDAHEAAAFCTDNAPAWKQGLE